MCAPPRKGAEFGRLISRHLRAQGHVLCWNLEARPRRRPGPDSRPRWFRLEMSASCQPASPSYLADQVRDSPGAGLDLPDTGTHP